MANDVGPPADSPLASPLEEPSLDLLRRAQAGSQEALANLAERFLPRLRRWAHGRLPPRARQLLDTEDLVQDAFLRTLQHFDALSPRRSAGLSAYIRQVILNRVRDELRKPKKMVALDDEMSARADAAMSPLEETVGRRTLDRYELAMAKLSPEDQEAVVARVEFGCGYAELAASLGKPSADAARMAVGRALVKLAREMTHVE